MPAIIDLVDNSVDGTRRLSGNKSLEGQWVHIDADSEAFTIEDNSGGMDIDVARDYAFRFGRPKAFTGVPKSVGQFGVGMKRAIFKLGDAFEISSAYRGEQSETGSRFRLKVDVREWEDDEKWTFRLDDFEERVDLDADETAGTKIIVTQLHPSVSDDLNDAVVLGDLKRQIRVLHQGPMQRGLTITVNGDELKATLPRLQSSGSIRPIHQEWDIPVGDATTSTPSCTQARSKPSAVKAPRSLT